MSRPWSAMTAAGLGALAVLAGCGGGQAAPAITAPTPATHSAFTITSGPHAVDCAACHGTMASFTQFDCLGCHAAAPTAAVHPSVTVGTYEYSSPACYSCHQVQNAHPFDHRVTAACATCHASGAAYAALPAAGFVHPAIGTQDCAACHQTTGWSSVTAPSALVADPAAAVAVTAQVPRFTGTTLTAFTASPQTLPMSMDHASPLVTALGLACADCHATAAAGRFFPGRFHSTLANKGLPPPARCLDCHAPSAPTGFVGPLATAPVRVPPSGEMRHDAMAWSATSRGSGPLVTADCAACHQSPTAAIQATWATGPGGGAVRYHASLQAAGLPSPSSCLDCHANGRPTSPLAAPGAALPAGVKFDHSGATADCTTCHASTAAWSGGRFHLAGTTTPTSCLPCHEGQRPTSTTGWTGAGWSTSPFDYGVNALGLGHGAGLDCVTCHAGPGTGGAWGRTETFTGGKFPHGAGTLAATTCQACHQAQRPDRLLGQAAAAAALQGFDHALNGTGDCLGCHEATVTAGRYVALYGPGGALPGGDWAGGTGYPGATLVGSPSQVVTVATLTLQRASAGGPVTGLAAGKATLQSEMLHVSAAIPAAIAPGPASAPDAQSCWHCHTHDAGGAVTSYAEGRFHASLDQFSASPGGPVTPLAQPTSGCSDCHAGMRPPALVERAASDLRPMDHAAALAPGSTVGGQSVTHLDALDCGACHRATSGTWDDGALHAALGAAVPSDCVACHYPLMADATAADVTSTTSAASFQMVHRSGQVTIQACATCHTGALAAAQGGGAATAVTWRPGSYHASLPAQPGACADCHAVSEPAAGHPTQGTVTYLLAAGGTPTNGGQWMNHGATAAAALDCAACHAADAKASGSTWSRSAAFHAHAASPGSCGACHGLQNGNGGVPGAGNNLPAGLTSSAMVSSAAGDPASGVPAGTHDQISHADVNVTGHDCAFCHTQAGPSTAPGVQGAEWAQARLHASFSNATPLVLDGAAGRCSNCHLGVKPAAGMTAQDHSAFTAAAGTQDCSACHAWPGTGTPAAPNWLGATGTPQFIAVGGFAIPQPPATAPTTQAGIASLPHPTVSAGTSCATCHAGGAGGKHALGYDHASALAAANCGACHEAGSPLVGTAWNGAAAQATGAGDTRPFTLTSLVATRGGDSCTINLPNHFFPVDCAECHATPAGTGATTSGAAYTAAWTFPHTNSRMSNPSTCNLCHVGQGCGR